MCAEQNEKVIRTWRSAALAELLDELAEPIKPLPDEVLEPYRRLGALAVREAMRALWGGGDAEEVRHRLEAAPGTPVEEVTACEGTT